MLERTFRALATSLLKLFWCDSNVLHVASKHKVDQIFIVIVNIFVFFLIFIILVRLKN